MAEYAKNFRAIESQIYNMTFEDRLLNFVRPLPRDLTTFIHTSTQNTEDIVICSLTVTMKPIWAEYMEDEKMNILRRKI